jgi:hypothetical protein
MRVLSLRHSRLAPSLYPGVFGAAILVATGSCTKDATGPVVQVPASLTLVSGNGQKRRSLR